MSKGRWAQLSGINAEKPILMLEGNVPFYKEDLVDLVKEEIAKDLPKDISTLFISSVAQQGMTELKDIIWKNLNE